VNTDDLDLPLDEQLDWYADVIATPENDSGSTGTNTSRPRVTSFGEAFTSLLNDLACGKPPVEWTPEDTPWGSLALHPGEVHCIGAASAFGKTSLVLNIIDRLLERYPDVRILVASNDMSTKKMAERLVSMRSGISYEAIRKCDKSKYSSADLEAVQAQVAGFHSRLHIMERPFTIEQTHELALDFEADIVFVDHLQAADQALETGRDSQQRIAATMRTLRRIADAGPCVITTAAMSRAGIERAQQRAGKTDVNALDMSVFLHGSEIEYVTDNAYLLLAEPGTQVATTSDGPSAPDRMWLHCVKARDSARSITPLLFAGHTQKFTLRTLDKAAVPRSANPKSDGSTNTRIPRGLKNPATPSTKKGGTKWLN